MANSCPTIMNLFLGLIVTTFLLGCFGKSHWSRDEKNRITVRLAAEGIEDAAEISTASFPANSAASPTSDDSSDAAVPSPAFVAADAAVPSPAFVAADAAVPSALAVFDDPELLLRPGSIKDKKVEQDIKAASTTAETKGKNG